MHNLKKSKKIVNVNSELDIFLATGMEIFSSLNKKNNKSNHKIDEKNNFDKFYTTAEKKIDSLIAEYEKVKISNGINSSNKSNINKNLENIAESRNHLDKKPDMPHFEICDNSEKIYKMTSDPLHDSLSEKPKTDKKIEKKIINKAVGKKDITKNRSSFKLPRFKIRKRSKKNKSKDMITPVKNHDSTKISNTTVIGKTERNSSKVNDSETESIEKNVSNNINKEKVKISDINKCETEKKENLSEKLDSDNDLIKILKITDNLLEELPDEVIEKFVNSKDFSLYEKVIRKYQIKWLLWVY